MHTLLHFLKGITNNKSYTWIMPKKYYNAQTIKNIYPYIITQNTDTNKYTSQPTAKALRKTTTPFPK